MRRFVPGNTIFRSICTLLLASLLLATGILPAFADEMLLTNADTCITLAGDTELIVNGDVTVDVSDKQLMPAISVQSGTVTLTLNGSLTVKGAPGFAGLYVAPGATLVVRGQGALYAYGGRGSGSAALPAAMQSGSQKRGEWGGGAGIGGNGQWMYTNQQWIAGTSASFGKVAVRGGQIHAFGGKTNSYNLGAGAGIGSGGANDSEWDYAQGAPVTGEIEIAGGTVTATGGEGHDNSLTGGGAGIGAGGVNGTQISACLNGVEVNVLDGTVIAAGMADGAGIGGGANTDSGRITILGGAVTATGSCEMEDGVPYGAYGGAGIGGGDNGGVTAITIAGTANVTARARGAAAGIGGGNDGGVGVYDYTNPDEEKRELRVPSAISIGGQARVIAFGGSAQNSRGVWFGGAGIGAGRSYYSDNGCGTVSIMDQAHVRALAGKRAQAVGVGSDYGGEDVNRFHVGADTINVWMFNQDTELAAFWGQNEAGDSLNTDYSTEGAVAVWYTHPKDGSFPAPRLSLTAHVDAADRRCEWMHDIEKTVTIYEDNKLATAESYSGMVEELGNWGTFLPMRQQETPPPANEPQTPAPTAQPTVQPTETPAPPPKTGDSTHPELLMLLMALALSAPGLGRAFGRRKRGT